MRVAMRQANIEGDREVDMATVSSKPSVQVMQRFEYKVIDTSKGIEAQLNELGAAGWQVVGVTTKKQFFIAPPQAIILMREVVNH